MKSTMKSKMNPASVFLVLFVACWIAVVLFRLVMVMESTKRRPSGAYVASGASGTCPVGQVCMSQDEFERISNQRETVFVREQVQVPVPVHVAPSITEPSLTRERDLRVLHDPLYPAYNRTDRDNYELVAENTFRRNINVPTQRFNDSYRLIGYASNSDDEVGRWKVFGRQKDRNRGDYYMVPVNKNYDLKVQITDKIVVGEKLRDIDTVPDTITFDSPLLAQTPYTFVELPKGDLRDELL